MRRLLIALLLVAPLLHADEVHVFAAASLTDALREIAAKYQQISPHDEVLFNFAGSSTLARQIAEGAPADIFVSADEAQMNRVANFIDAQSRMSVLSNTLVIVGERDLLKAKSIALAEPSSVPAGVYARQWLTKRGLWDRVKAKVIPTENVRAALAAVEAGNADSAIVYKTDAKNGFAISDGPKISYPFALTKSASAAAKRFFTYLTSPAARDVFRRFGFITR